MARGTELIDEIKYETAKDILNFEQSYDKEADTLVLRPEKAASSVSVDLHGLFWIRVNPEDYSIVGIDIEDYHQLFAKMYNLTGEEDPQIKSVVIDLIDSRGECETYTKEDYFEYLKKATIRI